MSPRKTPARVLVGIAAAAAMFVSLAPVASADPAADAAQVADGMSDTEAQQITGVVLDDATPEILAARQELARLIIETARATEDYNAAQVAQDQAEVDAAAAQERETAAEASVAALQDQIGQFARQTYQNGGPASTVAALLNAKGPTEVMHNLEVNDRVAEAQNDTLDELEVAKADAEKAAEDAKKALDAAAAAEVTMQARAAQITTQTAEQTTRLQELETDRAREERLAREAAAAAAARAALVNGRGLSSGSTAAAGSATSSNRASTGSVGAGTVSADAPTVDDPRVATALAYAYAQLGKPYVWGATGPGSFDCSGLTLQAWKAAGINIPRVSRDQAAAFPKVPRDQLRPGDMVYFGSPVYHVAMYIGDGMMINAPNSNSVVRIERMWGDYVSANRVTG